MAALRLAARSIGMICREMADAHSGIEPCPCGWQPHPATDVELLGMALLTACEQPRPADLRLMIADEIGVPDGDVLPVFGSPRTGTSVVSGSGGGSRR